MAGEKTCRIGHEKLNITISVLTNQDGSVAIKSELILGKRGSIETLGYRVVSPARIPKELETFIGKAWTWFDTTGIHFPAEARCRSMQSVDAILSSVRAS